MHRALQVQNGTNEDTSFPATRRVAVIGEDEVAYALTKELAKAGLEVALIMKSDEILPIDFSSGETYGLEQLEKNKLVRVYPSSTVTGCVGFVGAYRLEIALRVGMEALEVGAIVVTTGYKYGFPEEFIHWGSLKGVSSVRDVLRFLSTDALELIAFVVLPGASAFEFWQVLKAAEVSLDQGVPHIFILCEDVRVSDRGLESLYASLRERRVMFIKYGNVTPLVLESGQGVSIRTGDISLSGMMKEKTIVCDRIFVADKVLPDKKAEELARLLDINTDTYGYFQDDNVYHFPVQSNRRGIYIAGLAKRDAGDIQFLNDVQTVTGEINNLIGRGSILVDWATSCVDSDKCALCLTCLRTCPASAIRVDYENRAAEVVEVACQGCGICTAVCPAMAIELKERPGVISVVTG